MTLAQSFTNLWLSTGITAISGGQLVMIGISLLLIYLAISKGFEPLLLLPIGFGGILANVPIAGIAGPEGFLGMINMVGLETGIFPLMIFMGVGAMTDFGPLLANPRTALLGAAAQFGIFATLLGAKALGFGFAEAASIAIIGGADGPTAIYLTSQLASHLLGPIAVAAYSYMALVPVIQPPIIRLLTTRKERVVVMSDVKPVSQRVKIIFPIATTIVIALSIPAATPLVGMLMLGNLFREAGVVERLSKTAQNELINIVTILLGVSVGSKMSAEGFLTVNTLLIIGLGLVAFSVGTASGVLLGKMMYILSGKKVNPMIGAAGVSAVPMAARVVQKVGQKENPGNFLLMNAMGPNAVSYTHLTLPTKRIV